jgi:hypothetical protein
LDLNQIIWLRSRENKDGFLLGSESAAHQRLESLVLNPSLKPAFQNDIAEQRWNEEHNNDLRIDSY